MLRQDGGINLPEELILQIFFYLSARDLARASLVCRAFDNFANDAELWKQNFKHDYPCGYASSLKQVGEKNYKAKYKLIVAAAVKNVSMGYPRLYKLAKEGELLDLSAMMALNANQRHAVEGLLAYIEGCSTGSVTSRPVVSDLRFFRSRSADSTMTNQRQRVSLALKAVVFGEQPKEYLADCVDLLTNEEYRTQPDWKSGVSQLWNIYRQLVKANLLEAVAVFERKCRLV